MGEGDRSNAPVLNGAQEGQGDDANAGPRTAPPVIHVGLDIGSTTTKVAVLDPDTGELLFWNYRRHGARQAQSVIDILSLVAENFPASTIRVAVCGSGARGIADALDVPYIQEVVANAVAIQTLYPQVRTAIELGGQDAKMIFFREDDVTGTLTVADMRMNGSCAGGTGAFIDEIAKLLDVEEEGIESLASKGHTLHDISGRCGVYAKTDIQPLLNQGVPKEDIALSSLHAVAKQTIGGLAQGLDINPPVIFEGGSLYYNPTLQRVFKERLNLSDDEAVVPEHPQIIVAQGAALSLADSFKDADATVDPSTISERLEVYAREQDAQERKEAKPLFSTPEERAEFDRRQALPPDPEGPAAFACGDTVHAWLGIDSGSTTTKFALLDDDGELIDQFYALNEGDPLEVARRALIDLRERWRDAGITLDIQGVGTTGYGEALFAAALHADYHTVETVSHAKAATRYVPDATFVLDIGGQDMKAIWLTDGILTDIVVNEACSSGCGSFLENFASGLGVSVDQIAEAAFRSKSPATLGSRCTVFMTSSIVSEQRRGKQPDDILAGLCDSIIENVFTKVIRISNLDRLGDKVVVQGGTFKNDAVLRCLELYIGREVVRAPYPGLMGAIGIGLLTKERVEAERAKLAERGESYTSTFIGLDALDAFTYESHSNVVCPHCNNHCNRTVILFNDGSTFITGNRCPRGATLDGGARRTERPHKEENHVKAAPNLYDDRLKLLTRAWEVTPAAPDRGITIGIPRVLYYWDNLPFWSAFWRTLGFQVRLSRPSTHTMYERGLAHVTSDTICFPAKLTHGHILDLVDAGVDRIFMPSVTTVPSENTAKTSQSMCAVVKGYPIVMRNSDNPERRYDVPFDTPLFHWYTDADRERQLCAYMEEQFQIPAAQTRQAIAEGQKAQDSFSSGLLARGQEVIDEAHEQGGFAIVLAGRPYHNDPLVNHGLPRMIASMGIPVLTADSVPGVREVDLSNSRIDIVNNFHARMLGSAVVAARSDDLEYIQLVSFGCGHDAYLSDEIIRLMREAGNKTPLVLKIDETDATGSLKIRVRSFIETVQMRRDAKAKIGRAKTDRAVVETDPGAETATTEHEAAGRALVPARRRGPTLKRGPKQEAEVAGALRDPYPVKFTKQDRKRRVILVPNTSHAFSRLMAAVFSRQGVIAEPLPLGHERAIELGKRYVHNDICFPAQMTIGESLEALESGKYDDSEVAIGMGKYVGDCRLTHYSALLRKALDDSGHEDVAVITNDDVDAHDMHPGFKMSLVSAVNIAVGLPMIDVLEELLRKMRPYELEPGSANRAFEEALDALMDGIEKDGIPGAKKGFERAIDIMCQVRYDRSHPRPRVLIVGEYLLNFHPGANHEIEQYLEDNGLEIIEARMTDVIRKTYFYKHAQVTEYHVDLPVTERTWYAIADNAFELAHDLCDSIACRHPLYEKATRLPEIADESDQIFDRTFDAGEGILIPGEILHHAKHGCRAFVILQPFGCLPNHVVGRGIVRRLKELYPDAQILSLDYDPDVSFANVENRLQMLIMNVRAAEAGGTANARDNATEQEDAPEGTGNAGEPREATVKQGTRGASAPETDVSREATDGQTA